MASLYEQLLGPSWSRLAPQVRRVHGGAGRASGSFVVTRGTGALARLVGWLMGLPAASPSTPVRLEVSTDAAAERWRRAFGDTTLCTTQWASGASLVEGLGPVQCWFHLREDAGALVFEQERSTVGARGVSVPLPPPLAPIIRGRAEPCEVGVHVHVRIEAPLVGLLVDYDGVVEAA